MQEQIKKTIRINHKVVTAWEIGGIDYLSLRAISQLNKALGKGPLDRRTILSHLDSGLFPGAIQAQAGKLNSAWMVPVSDYLAAKWPEALRVTIAGKEATVVLVQNVYYLSLEEVARLNKQAGKRPSSVGAVSEGIREGLYPNATQHSVGVGRPAWYIPVGDYLNAPEPAHGRPSPVADYRGKVQGRLTITEPTAMRSHRNVVWRARCSCGNEILVPTTSIRRNMPQSCGCASPRAWQAGSYRERHEKV